MIPVAQTKDWNCFAACLASVLEMPLEELPAIDPNDYGETWLEWGRWRDDWLAWLEGQGLVMYDINFGAESVVRGYTIGTVHSQRLEDSLHSVVCKDGVPVWDPQTANERLYTAEDVDSHTLLVPINPSFVVSKVSAAPTEEEMCP